MTAIDRQSILTIILGGGAVVAVGLATMPIAERDPCPPRGDRRK
jgi:hypothetical protein